MISLSEMKAISIPRSSE